VDTWGEQSLELQSTIDCGVERGKREKSKE
jgi:hypothetical protein